MAQSSEIDKLAAALVKAQAEFTHAKKDSANPFFKSKYADLATCIDVVRPVLAKYGLAVIQPCNGTALETIILHESGQWISGSLTLTPVDNKPQSVGSAITYGRRYCLQAMLGLASEDDDGNSASGNGVAKGGVKEHIVAQAAAIK